MKNEHQLIVENWRRFVVEQTQPQQQMNPLQVVQSFARQIVTNRGPSEETKKAINNTEIARQLLAFIKKNDFNGAVDYLFKDVLYDDDPKEVSIVANTIIDASKQSQSTTQPAVKEAKRPGPIFQTTAAIASLAERGLTNLGGGDLNVGLKKFSNNSATIVLCGMILANLVSAYQTKDASAIQDILELVPQLRQSLSFTNPTQLINVIKPVSQTNTMQESTEYNDAHLDDGTLVCAGCLQELLESQRTIIQEAKYQGRTVQLNKPMKGDVKKSKVYVKDPKTGNVKKVNFGDKNMKIKKSNPKRRKSFRARHNCENPGPKTKARYWSCKAW